MKLDLVKFNWEENRGICVDPRNEDFSYEAYKKQKRKIIEHVRDFVEKNQFSSAGAGSILDHHVLMDAIKENPERATHILVDDILQKGCSWEHLSLLYYLMNMTYSLPEQGKYIRQLIQVLRNYESMFDPVDSPWENSK